MIDFTHAHPESLSGDQKQRVSDLNGWLKKDRVSMDSYAMMMAHVASFRSEDPYRKVGAVAFSKEKRIIAAAYNGLYPGFDASEGFWEDRDARQRFMQHAEINLCSLMERGKVEMVAITTIPCTSCMQALCAHGVKRILYRDDYPGSHSKELAEAYGIELTRIDDYPLVGLVIN